MKRMRGKSFWGNASRWVDFDVKKGVGLRSGFEIIAKGKWGRVGSTGTKLSRGPGSAFKQKKKIRFWDTLQHGKTTGAKLKSSGESRIPSNLRNVTNSCVGGKTSTLQLLKKIR